MELKLFLWIYFFKFNSIYLTKLYYFVNNFLNDRHAWRRCDKKVESFFYLFKILFLLNFIKILIKKIILTKILFAFFQIRFSMLNITDFYC